MTVDCCGPETAAVVFANALRGDCDAQFSAGLMYARGIGVQRDRVQACFWFSLASEQGDSDAAYVLQQLAVDMDESAREAARRLRVLVAGAGSAASVPLQ
jgi:TPR repeat protein